MFSSAANDSSRPSPPVLGLIRAGSAGGVARVGRPFPSASTSASWDDESLAGSPSSAAGGGFSLSGSRASTPLNGVDEMSPSSSSYQQQRQQQQQLEQGSAKAATTHPGTKDESTTDACSSLSSFTDLSGCLRSALARLPVLQQTLPLVHLGFWGVYSSMRAQVISSVLVGIFQHYARVSPPSGAGACDGTGAGAEPLQISFCGHSLGGGLAVLAALDVATNLGVMCRAARDCVSLRLHSSSSSTSTSQQQQQLGIDVVLPNVSLYTFGCPRVGNKLFCDALKKRVPTVYRVELEGDSVTMMPPNYLGFYRHCGRRVVVDPHGSGSLIVKPTIVETVLLGKSSYSVLNHSLDSYRVALEACFSPDELAVYLSKEYHRTIGGRAGPVAPLPAWLTDEQY